MSQDQRQAKTREALDLAKGHWVCRDDWGVIGLKGPDAAAFLHALATQDLKNQPSDRVVYSLLLNPQGRYVSDFFVVPVRDGKGLDGMAAGKEGELSDGLLLVLNQTLLPEVLAFLGRYRLRHQVALINLSEKVSFFSFVSKKSLQTDSRLMPPYPASTPGQITWKPGMALFQDPRLACFGPHVMVFQPQNTSAAKESESQKATPAAPVLADLGLPFAHEEEGMATSSLAAFQRFLWGVCEGDDLVPLKAIPLTYGLHRLGGVSLNKGCYLGQELVSRTLHRGQLNKVVLPAFIRLDAERNGEMDLLGANVYQEEGKALGRIVRLLPFAVDQFSTLMAGGAPKGGGLEKEGWPYDALFLKGVEKKHKGAGTNKWLMGFVRLAFTPTGGAVWAKEDQNGFMPLKMAFGNVYAFYPHWLKNQSQA